MGRSKYWKTKIWIGFEFLWVQRSARRMSNFLSSPNFFILLTPFTPIKRFFTHSTLLGGILPCEIRSFWHPGSFWNFSGTEVRAVFVRRIFQKNLIFLLLRPGWDSQQWYLYLCVSVFLYLCISCLSVCILCICIRIWGVFVYFQHFLLPALLFASPSSICRQSLPQCAETQPLPL